MTNSELASMPTTYCLVDQRPIPRERAVKRATTCSQECAQVLTKMRRDMIDRRKCRLCGVPSTPEQRKLYQQWRRETGLVNPKGRPKKPAPPAEEEAAL